MNQFIAVVMYRSQQRSQRIEVKVKKWHRLYSGLLDVARIPANFL